MNPSHPDEGPEHRTDTLSPLSPKPVHFPVPSNIPLLEHQMDPGLGDASLADNLATNIPATLAPNGTHTQEIAQPDGAPLNNDDAANGVNSQHELDGGAAVAAEMPAATHVDPNLADLFSPHQPPSSQPGTLVDTTVGPNPLNPQTTNGDLHNNGESLAQFIANHHFQDQGSDQQIGNTDVKMEGENVVDASEAANDQALLDSISAASLVSPNLIQDGQLFPASLVAPDVAQASSSQVLDANMLSPNSDSLPPRPPALQATDDEIQSATIASAIPNQDALTANPSLAAPGVAFPTPGQLQAPFYTAGAPGTSNGPMNGLPPPPTATFQQEAGSPMRLNDAQSTFDVSRPLKKEDDVPWGPEIQKIYDGFLDDERKYVMEGNWDRFPSSSRLFIGNLPTEKVTKRDLFHVFHKHGKLAQISIKQAYGFVQFLTSESCLDALQKEQGVSIRGRKVHLEVSKPQKNTRNQKRDSNRERRSRSPERNQGQRADRYRGNGNNSRNNNNNNNNRNDGWRPNRSPSPRGRDRDRRSPDFYEGRRRSRSQDRARFGKQGDDDDSLPLPRRHPTQVPDVQVIARDDPDKNFLTYVEKQFEARGVRCNVLMLSPRLNEAAVMRRQIIEGVQAVMKVNRMTQMTQKFALSIFDRSGGSNNVRFEEYTDLDLRICVELVVRAKQTHRPPPSDYSTNQYGLPMTPGGGMRIPPPPMPPSQLSPHGASGGQMNFPAQAPQAMDSSSLQQLLGSLGQQQPQQSNRLPFANSPQQGQSTADLSRLLGNVGQQGGPSFQNPQTQQQFQSLASNPTFAGLFGSQAAQGGSGSANVQQNHPSQHQQQPNQSQPPDMQNIMAQLARYGR